MPGVVLIRQESKAKPCGSCISNGIDINSECTLLLFLNKIRRLTTMAERMISTKATPTNGVTPRVYEYELYEASKVVPTAELPKQ